MSRRIDIPFLVDLLLVDEAALMTRLNGHPNIGRHPVKSGRWINEAFRKHIESHLRVGDSPLPVFVGPEPAASRAPQKDLAARFDAAAAEGLNAHAEDVRRLAAYVAGGAESGIGVITQRIVGRMYQPAYSATAESYQAAGVLAGSADPIRGAIPVWTGGLARALARLGSAAANDVHCIHGTAVALPHVVATVRIMRKAFEDGDADRHATPADAVRSYMRVPPMLLRSCAADTQVEGLGRPLRAGTLVIFQLAKTVATSGEFDRAFARGEWNQCPASRAAFVLLEQVWEGACRVRRGGTAAAAAS